jgi:hypothetical protein
VAQLEIPCQAPDTGVTTPGDASAGCRSDKDCPSMQYCATNQGGGITYCSTKINEVKCSVDDDCVDAGAGTICENYLCPSGMGRSCFPGCTDAQCGPTDQTGLVCANESPVPSEAVPAAERVPDQLRLQRWVLSAAHVHDRRGLPGLLRQREMRQRVGHLRSTARLTEVPLGLQNFPRGIDRGVAQGDSVHFESIGGACARAIAVRHLTTMQIDRSSSPRYSRNVLSGSIGKPQCLMFDCENVC